MNLLVTGSNGFIGKNLICELKNRGYNNIFEFDTNKTLDDLNSYVQNCDFIFHLAGINRPKNAEDFMKGNFGFTSDLISLLKKYNNNCPIVVTSSIQAELDNPYGKSKLEGENVLHSYANETGANVFIYRLPNVFGKWCKPNYNSAVATFCNNIAKNLPIKINDYNSKLNLVYIDDVVKEFISCLDKKSDKKLYSISNFYETTVGKVADLINSFKESRNNLKLPNLSNDLEKKLYSTYLSYLSEDDFSYKLKMNVDDRGSFTEFLKTQNKGQVSINIAKSGITKGNHWHHTKNEKFLVVSGEGLIRFRKINDDKIIEYKVSGGKLEVVDIPVGYTHSIKNIGHNDLVTVMWVNEVFDKDNPDTFYLEV